LRFADFFSAPLWKHFLNLFSKQTGCDKTFFEDYWNFTKFNCDSTFQNFQLRDMVKVAFRRVDEQLESLDGAQYKPPRENIILTFFLSECSTR
jgi:hypothetical protein